MGFESNWAVLNVRLARALPLVVASATIGFASPAIAAGTTAGTNIANTATATYTDPGNAPRTITSNTVTVRVDELLDVAIARVSSSDVPTTPGATDQVHVFTVTNTGNGPEAFVLSVQTSLGGDQFDPNSPRIFYDTNNNGQYDAGTDTPYSGTTPSLAADTSVQVLVLANIPAGANDNDRGQINLVANAATGTGAPGTAFAGQGFGGGDAVVGSSGASGTGTGFYLVQNATVTFTKTQSVLDPFNGSRTLPGSIITYTLTANVAGTGTISNLEMTDPIPGGTDYVAGSMTLQSVALTDASDADAGFAVGTPTVTSIRVAVGTVPSGQTRTVTFRVRVKTQ